jgi:hypothetical protein
MSQQYKSVKGSAVWATTITDASAMARNCYSAPEIDWLETVCRAMNRWAMCSTPIDGTETPRMGSSALLGSSVANVAAHPKAATAASRRPDVRSSAVQGAHRPAMSALI